MFMTLLSQVCTHTKFIQWYTLNMHTFVYQSRLNKVVYKANKKKEVMILQP